jgi:hypothetical protein
MSGLFVFLLIVFARRYDEAILGKQGRYASPLFSPRVAALRSQ